MYKENQTGIITFGDKTTSKVKVTKIKTYPALNVTDIFFTYLDEETHRPLKHPEFGDMFPLPEGIANLVFTPDK